jgi:hypothetical protein
MGVIYEVNEDLGITFVVWYGVVNAEDYVHHATLMCSDRNWPPPERRQISDWRDASLDASMDLTAVEKVAGIYGAHSEKINNMKLAILAHDEFEQAVAFQNMIKAYGTVQVVFQDLKTVCLLLGLDFDQVQPALARLREAVGLTPGT